MKPPSDRARLVLERYKAAESLGSDEKARLGDLIGQRVLRGDLPRVDIQPKSPVPSPAGPAHQLWGSLLSKVGLAVLALGAAGGLVYQLHDARPAPAPGAPATVSTPFRVERATAVESSPIQEPEPLRPAENVRQTPSAAPHAKPSRSLDAPVASDPEPTIDEEMKLMNGAQAALRAGDTKRALELLKEHATRFPAGKLTSARQVTRMMALCQAGQTEQARREATNFLAQHPGSPFAERVKGICSPPGP